MKDERGVDPKGLAAKELRHEATSLLKSLEEEEFVAIEVRTEKRATRLLDWPS